MRVPVCALLLLAISATSAAGQTAPSRAEPIRPDAPDWRGTGIVLKLLPPPSELHTTRPVIVIQHEPIAGLMEESMTMPFIAASTALFRGLRAGDRISFGLKEVPDALLVIGTHGRTGLTRLFIGSVAERVVRIAPTPVLVSKPRSAVERARVAEAA